MRTSHDKAVRHCSTVYHMTHGCVPWFTMRRSAICRLKRICSAVVLLLKREVVFLNACAASQAHQHLSSCNPTAAYQVHTRVVAVTAECPGTHEPKRRSPARVPITSPSLARRVRQSSVRRVARVCDGEDEGQPQGAKGPQHRDAPAHRQAQPGRGRKAERGEFTPPRRSRSRDTA